MTDLATIEAYGALIEPTTLKIERLLPGPIERVWAYITDSDLRRKWLSAGQMDMKVGGTFELVWRNDELTNPPGQRPEGYSEEHRAECQMTVLEPPRKIGFTFGNAGDVTFELTPKGSNVLLTVIHRRLVERNTRLGVSAGWHSHLDLLVAEMTHKAPEPHWDHFSSLRKEYDRRLPA